MGSRIDCLGCLTERIPYAARRLKSILPIVGPIIVSIILEVEPDNNWFISGSPAFPQRDKTEMSHTLSLNIRATITITTSSPMCINEAFGVVQFPRPPIVVTVVRCPTYCCVATSLPKNVQACSMYLYCTV